MNFFDELDYSNTAVVRITYEAAAPPPTPAPPPPTSPPSSGSGGGGAMGGWLLLWLATLLAMRRHLNPQRRTRHAKLS
ncbi:MAG: hypothetical protein R3E77_10305 [Steroidobacteraceae bacterium]